MNQSPSVSILILNWNGLDYTTNCLDSLVKINYQNYNIIIVDNGSENNEANVLKKKYSESIQVISNPENVGFAEGNNIAIREAIKNNSEYCCLLNNDMIVKPDFLSEMVRIASQDPKIGMVAPRSMKMDNHEEVDNLGIVMTLSGLTFNRKTLKHKMFCPSGGAVLYSTKVLQLTSENNTFLDSKYFAYAEDLDLGFRILLAGYKPAYADNSVVYHKGSASTSVMSDFTISHSQRNFIWTIIKDFPLSFIMINFIWILIMQIGVLLLYIKRNKLHLIINAYINAFKDADGFFRKRKVIQGNKKISTFGLWKYIEIKVFLASYFIQAIKK
ncbi:MAG: glycosyltransferase family 2 protein [Candidatus Kerfeldbacteria bacterium]